MFSDFFYLLRRRGLAVSLEEWLLLLEGLEKNLHRCSLTGFYHLCRTVLIKTEADYDKFDRAFLEFFQDIPYQEELPQELMDWLNHPAEDLRRTIEALRAKGFPDHTLEELLSELDRRLKEQDSQHNGGSYWVGTQGTSFFGNSGWHPNGLRIGGEGRSRTAMAVAGERNFRDFRKDSTLDIRQFQMAFRTLRQCASAADAAPEFDVDGTIHDTCDNGGTLKIRYKRPRKNAVKVLLLMDSGGSMDAYGALCSLLFQAATKSNHFKELHVYYFHNCVYDRLYTSPALRYDSAVPTEWVLHNFGSEYKVIFVGDAMMSPHELYEPRFSWHGSAQPQPSGLDWLKRFLRQYPHLIWLNPEALPPAQNYWTQTYLRLARLLPMYHLSIEGVEKGMRHLMAAR